VPMQNPLLGIIMVASEQRYRKGGVVIFICFPTYIKFQNDSESKSKGLSDKSFGATDRAYICLVNLPVKI